MLVVDHELQQLIQSPSSPLLLNFDPPNNWQSRESLVQPCSLDLHIGGIFQPGLKAGKPGTAGYPRTELVLKTGQTAIVCTQESINMPADHAGFGFPPSHISSRALLMTNPGHIDPGYSGTLQFTVINMGREDYVLRSRDLIVTLLLFRLSGKVDADYAARRPANAVATSIQQADIDRLSQDFVDVEKRAREIAKTTLATASVIASVLAVILTWGVNAVEKKADGVSKLSDQVSTLQQKNDSLSKQLQDTQQNLNKELDLDHRLAVIEAQSKERGK